MHGSRDGVGGTSTYRSVCVALTVALCTAMLLLAAGLVPLALTDGGAPVGTSLPAGPHAAAQDRSPRR